MRFGCLDAVFILSFFIFLSSIFLPVCGEHHRQVDVIFRRDSASAAAAHGTEIQMPNERRICDGYAPRAPSSKMRAR